MSTIHVEASKTQEDLYKFIDRESQKLDLLGASPNLKDKIRSGIQAKAGGSFLWVRLMFEILLAQTTEEDLLKSLATAPEDIDNMIKRILEVYSSTLHGRQPEEFNVILAWLSCAGRPVSLAELDAVLRRLSPTGSKVLGLEKRLRERFATLFTLIRDDGLSTGMLQARDSHLNAVSYNSIPETTRVAFSHESIADYFRAGNGKFSCRETAPKLGVALPEAHHLILQTSLEVFVQPGIGEKFDAAKALQRYSVENWLLHLKERHTNDLVDQTVVRTMELLHTFLTDEIVLRNWCRHKPWSFYCKTAATSIAEWLRSWRSPDMQFIGSSTQSWAEVSIRKPEKIFLPAADVNAKQGLHGPEWPPMDALLVVAQIKALNEQSDTLDTLPSPIPLAKILAAIEWTGLEKNITWHRKVALCLRNLGYVNEAIKYFNKALEMDESYVEARGGLAVVYRDQGNHSKVVELELKNTSILISRLQKLDPADATVINHRQELARCYEAISLSYQQLDDTPNALRFWQKAIDTGQAFDWAFFQYLKLLAKSHHDSCWDEIMVVLRTMEHLEDDTGQTQLTRCLLKSPYPSWFPHDFFPIIARAAKEGGTIPWLIRSYETAMESAKSNVVILTLKLSIIQLQKRTSWDLGSLEDKIEELIDIVSLFDKGTIQELESCKDWLAEDYCKICVRKAVTASSRQTQELYCSKLERLCKSGVWDRNVRKKIMYSEQSNWYVALVQQIMGRKSDAEVTLRPFIEDCYILKEHGNGRNWEIAVITLSECLIVLGRKEEAATLLTYLHSLSALRCKACRKRCDRNMEAAMCTLCLQYFCGSCLVCLQEADGAFQTYCVPGHRLLYISSSQARHIVEDDWHIVEDDNQREDASREVEKILKMVKVEFNLA
ncbi:hypothetical protein BDV96DRAFT_592119 [Lophiotrema nucula]|uniref:Uncharacterized protein n=1 Tax=Lophiotrema nucula TaxID=690887 RepID=A0A6A5YFI4_9PLEO|nr:hypothetical protein BDV96DRAFT_592119 [Lophiotrema nucula]